MDRRQSLHGFKLHDDSVINQEIGAESFLEHHPLVFEPDGLLALDLKAPANKRIRRGCVCSTSP